MHFTCSVVKMTNCCESATMLVLHLKTNRSTINTLQEKTGQTAEQHGPIFEMSMYGL